MVNRTSHLSARRSTWPSKFQWIGTGWSGLMIRTIAKRTRMPQWGHSVRQVKRMCASVLSGAGGRFFTDAHERHECPERLLERGHGEAVDDHCSLTLGDHQARVLQDGAVLREGAAGERETFGEIARGQITIAQQGQDYATRGIALRAEHTVFRHRQDGHATGR